MAEFYKTTIVVEVLSEGPLHFQTLSDLHSLITTGDCSGSIDVARTLSLSNREMAEAAREQGTDPGFFGLDATGNRLKP
jgi:hypothetical protein